VENIHYVVIIMIAHNIPYFTKPRTLVVLTALLVLIVVSIIILWIQNNSKPLGTILNGSIQLKTSELTKELISPGEVNTFSITLASGSRFTQEVLVDIELFNSSNERVAQHYWDNVRITKDKPISYEVSTPSNLPPGEYRYWVGIFKPDWGKLVTFWDAKVFYVGSSGLVEENPLVNSYTLTSVEK
jgi:hypothetical protein